MAGRAAPDGVVAARGGFNTRERRTRARGERKQTSGDESKTKTKIERKEEIQEAKIINNKKSTYRFMK